LKFIVGVSCGFSGHSGNDHYTASGKFSIEFREGRRSVAKDATDRVGLYNVAATFRWPSQSI